MTEREKRVWAVRAAARRCVSSTHTLDALEQADWVERMLYPTGLLIAESSQAKALWKRLMKRLAAAGVVVEQHDGRFYIIANGGEDDDK